MSDTESLALSDLILHASSEIRIAKEKIQEGGSDPVIQLSECELELAVTFKNEAKAGIKIWVVEAGANLSGETVSRIKMKFGPVAGNKAQFGATTDDPAGPKNPLKS